MGSADRRRALAGGVIACTAVAIAGILAMASQSFGTIVWNPVFDACGVAAVLGLGVIVSAMAIDGITDAQPVFFVVLGERSALSATASDEGAKQSSCSGNTPATGSSTPTPTSGS